jgi:pimeloyl-ACP methyl ester carboxylesterase
MAVSMDCSGDWSSGIEYICAMPPRSRRYQSTTSQTQLGRDDGMLLHYSRIQGTQSKSSSESTIVFLHGLLGQGKNLKTMADQMTTNSNGLLLDLRGHGQSQVAPGTSRVATFSLAAADIRKTMLTTLEKGHQSSSGRPPQLTVVGHSLGGRVALQYVLEETEEISRKNAISTLPLVSSLWLLDTVPSRPDPLVSRIVHTCAAIETESSPLSRPALTQRFMASANVEKSMAQWLASSYNTESGKFSFDTAIAQAFLSDFPRQNWLQSIETALKYGQTKIHIVRGAKNKQWEESHSLDRIHEMVVEYPGRCVFHSVPDAGHWVHVDNLPALIRIFKQHNS